MPNCLIFVLHYFFLFGKMHLFYLIPNYLYYIFSNFFSRTFLNTVEIVVICVFAVLIVFFLIGLAIYLFIFGCEVAPQLRRPDKDYIKIQRERERKIGELWLHNQSQTDHLERVNDDQGIILP